MRAAARPACRPPLPTDRPNCLPQAAAATSAQAAPARHSSRCTRGRCTATPGSCKAGAGSRAVGVLAVRPGTAGSAEHGGMGGGSNTANAQLPSPWLRRVQLHALHAVRPLREDFLRGTGQVGRRGRAARALAAGRAGSHPPRHRRRAAHSPGARPRQASPPIAAGSLHRRPTLMSSRSGCRQGERGAGRAG